MDLEVRSMIEERIKTAREYIKDYEAERTQIHTRLQIVIRKISENQSLISRLEAELK